MINFYRSFEESNSTYLYTYANNFVFQTIKIDLYMTFHKNYELCFFLVKKIMSYVEHISERYIAQCHTFLEVRRWLLVLINNFDHRFGTHVMTTSRFRLLSLQLILFRLFKIP